MLCSYSHDIRHILGIDPSLIGTDAAFPEGGTSRTVVVRDVTAVANEA